MRRSKSAVWVGALFVGALWGTGRGEIGLGGSVHAGEPLRIMAFNCECLAAPNARVSLERFRWSEARMDHIERVASIIETFAPDVCCLEEVTSGEALETLVKVLHDKGMTDYAGYHVESADRFTGFDVCMISRFKPDDVEGKPIRLTFSYAGDEKWREAYSFMGRDGETVNRSTSISRNALCYFTIHGHKLGLLGLHLKSNPEDVASNAQRTAEAKVAQKIIRDEIVARGYLPIVLGDLNDYDPDVADRDETRSPITQVIAGLKNFDAETPAPELYNAAEKVARQADRYTSHWDRNENGAADPYDVFSMIDHVLLPVSLRPHHSRTVIGHTSDLRTSDHFPVVVDLDLPKLAP